MNSPARSESPAPAALDKIVLLLVSGISQTDLENACVMKLAIEPQDVTATIAEARRRLTRAAEYNRDEQLGTAITRTNDIYARAIRASDVKTALAAQREINKLLDLYRDAGAGGDGGEGGDEAAGFAAAEHEITAIRAHLLPLGLATPTYPLREHARIAADLIRDQRGAKGEEGAFPEA